MSGTTLNFLFHHFFQKFSWIHAAIGATFLVLFLRSRYQEKEEAIDRVLLEEAIQRQKSEARAAYEQEIDPEEQRRRLKEEKINELNHNISIALQNLQA